MENKEKSKCCSSKRAASYQPFNEDICLSCSKPFEVAEQEPKEWLEEIGGHFINDDGKDICYKFKDRIEKHFAEQEVNTPKCTYSHSCPKHGYKSCTSAEQDCNHKKALKDSKIDFPKDYTCRVCNPSSLQGIKETWSEEFDKLSFEFFEGCDKDVYVVDTLKAKYFISQLLQDRDTESEHKLKIMKAVCEGAGDQNLTLYRAKLIERIEKLAKEPELPPDYENGYNHALKDIINIIKEK